MGSERVSDLDTAIRHFRRLHAFWRRSRCYANFGGHDYEETNLLNSEGDLIIWTCRRCGFTVSFQFGDIRKACQGYD